MNYIYCIATGLIIGMLLENLDPILDKEYLKSVNKRKVLMKVIRKKANIFAKTRRN